MLSVKELPLIWKILTLVNEKYDQIYRIYVYFYVRFLYWHILYIRDSDIIVTSQRRKPSLETQKHLQNKTNSSQHNRNISQNW